MVDPCEVRTDHLLEPAGGRVDGASGRLEHRRRDVQAEHLTEPGLREAVTQTARAAPEVEGAPSPGVEAELGEPGEQRGDLLGAGRQEVLLAPAPAGLVGVGEHRPQRVLLAEAGPGPRDLVDAQLLAPGRSAHRSAALAKTASYASRTASTPKRRRPRPGRRRRPADRRAGGASAAVSPGRRRGATTSPNPVVLDDGAHTGQVADDRRDAGHHGDDLDDAEGLEGVDRRQREDVERGVEVVEVAPRGRTRASRSAGRRRCVAGPGSTTLPPATPR